MTLNDFISKYNGKKVSWNGTYRGQCVSLTKVFESEMGWPIINGNAKDQPNNFDKNAYIWINNGQYTSGDLIVFNYPPLGHISIFIEGDGNSFRSFEQNFPIGSPAHVQNHSYNSVIGAIRKKENKMWVNKIPELFQQKGDSKVYMRMPNYDLIHIPSPEFATDYLGAGWSSTIQQVDDLNSAGTVRPDGS